MIRRKRHWALLVAGVILGGWLVHLGGLFFELALPETPLTVEQPHLPALPADHPGEIELRGRGFDTATRVTLVPGIYPSSALIGRLPLEGIYNTSLLVDDILYLGGNQRGLQLIDVSHPEQPELIDEYLVGRSILDIHRQGKHLFLACGQLGMVVMELGSAGRLTQLATIPVSPAAVASATLGQQLYVAAASEGLLVYDIENLANIVRSDQWGEKLFVRDIVTYDDLVYLISRKQELSILSPGQDAQLQEQNRIPLTTYPQDLTVAAGRLYVGTRELVAIYDLADPSQPELLHQLADIGSADRIFVGEKTLYVSDSYSQLNLYKLDPSARDEVSRIAFITDIRTLVEQENLLFLAGSENGLLVVDRALLAGLQTSIPSFSTTGQASDLSVRGHYLYVADGSGGLQCIDLRTKFNLQKLVAGRVESLAFAGDQLFLTRGRDGLEIFDLSNPVAPVSLQKFPELSSWRLAFAGDYLALTRGIAGLVLMKRSAPGVFQIAAKVDDIHPLGIAAAGKQLYVATKDNGLQIYQISGQDQLRLQGSLKLPFPMAHFSTAVDLAVTGDLVAIANGDSGLLLVDIENQAQPQLLASVALPGFSKAIALAGQRAYVGARRGGISIVDLSNPEQPQVQALIDLRGISRGLQVQNGRIFIGRYRMGVSIVAEPQTADILEIDSSRLRVRLPEPAMPGVYDLQVSNQNTLVRLPGVVEYQ